jgi:hypothetical protein
MQIILAVLDYLRLDKTHEVYTLFQGHSGRLHGLSVVRSELHHAFDWGVGPLCIAAK